MNKSASILSKFNDHSTTVVHYEHNCKNLDENCLAQDQESLKLKKERMNQIHDTKIEDLVSHQKSTPAVLNYDTSLKKTKKITIRIYKHL